MGTRSNFRLLVLITVVSTLQLVSPRAEAQCPPCWADCDNSFTLDIFDFLCFGNRFAAGESYACNCDLTTGQGVCDIFDFLCFQNRYVAGCDFRPDLIVTNIVHETSCVGAGQTMMLQFTLWNRGCGPATGTGIRNTIETSLGCAPGHPENVFLRDEFFDLATPLMPSQLRLFSLPFLRIPANHPPGETRIMVVADADNVIPELNENNNFVCGPTFPIVCPDIEVTAVTALNGSNRRPGELIDVRVEYRNNGNAIGTFPIRVEIGSSSATSLVQAPTCGNSGLTTIQIPAPPTVGQGCSPPPVGYSVRACANLPSDCNTSNDCMTVQGQVTVRPDYWNIVLFIFDVPSQVCHGGRTTWGVRAVNMGNAPTPSECAVRVISGINCISTCGNWACNLGQHSQNLPVLNPGASHLYWVRDYNVPFFSPIGTVYIKAEICTQQECPGTCGDPCSSGNCAQESTTIIFCG